MGTYNVPRNVKGEGRILYIFSYKALVYTAVGIGIGLILYLIFSLIGLTFVGVILIGIFGLIGFSIATFKVPDTNRSEFTKKTGGENIDEIIKRGIKFKMQKKKIYVYTPEEKIENKEESKDE
ncbi:MAG: hypothetical protein HFJ36_04765 [Clostridia bacterium]|nr:hypothetical protein [Clostridia bacterium]